MIRVESELVCPGCGASVGVETDRCSYCGRRIVLTSFKDTQALTKAEAEDFMEKYAEAIADPAALPQVKATLGFLHMQRKDYARAAEAFNEALKSGAQDPDLIFYGVICEFRKQLPSAITLQRGEGLIGDLEAALSVKPAPQYAYLKAELIKRIFERRFVRFKERSSQVYQAAVDLHLSPTDKKNVDELLGD